MLYLTFPNGGFPVAVSLVKYEEDSKLHLSSYFACTILQLVKQNMAKCVRIHMETYRGRTEAQRYLDISSTYVT